MSERNQSPDPGYSRAFENFVREADDITGLLACALYKRSINEREAGGLTVVLHAERDPQKHEVSLYRSQAEGYLKGLAQGAIEDERPAIVAKAVGELASEMRSEIRASASDVKGQTRLSTGFWWPGVTIGVVAWFISILITILVLYAAPDWARSLVQHIGQR